jgi:hypothetical protein
MGYANSPGDPSPLAKIELRSISKRDFELMTAFVYTPAGEREPIKVPTHPNDCALSTDLASVPPLLWGLLPSYGRQLRGALLHDRLCDVVNAALEAPDADRTEAYRERRLADGIFFEAMRDKGSESEEDMAKRVGWFRAKLFWTGVSYGRYWKFRRVRAAVMTVQVLAGVVAVDLLARLAPLSWLADRLPWEWVQDGSTLAWIWVAALVGSVVWGRDWQVPFIGVLVGPLILPVLLLTLVVQVVLALPDQVLHWVRPKVQPPPDLGPTATLAGPNR